jgi:hypothetical protein
MSGTASLGILCASFGSYACRRTRTDTHTHNLNALHTHPYARKVGASDKECSLFFRVCRSRPQELPIESLRQLCRGASARAGRIVPFRAWASFSFFLRVTHNFFRDREALSKLRASRAGQLSYIKRPLVEIEFHPSNTGRERVVHRMQPTTIGY